MDYLQKLKKNHRGEYMICCPVKTVPHAELRLNWLGMSGSSKVLGNKEQLRLN